MREILRKPGFQTLPSRDALNAVNRNDVARVAYKAVDMIITEKPAAQAHGAALLFLAITQRLGADPREVLTRAERILDARHEDYDPKANPWFGALSDFIDHVHDPKRNLGLR